MPGESTLDYVERLVDAMPELVQVVFDSVNVNTDTDMCGVRHSIIAGNIAEDVVQFLIETGWTPPPWSDGIPR